MSFTSSPKLCYIVFYGVSSPDIQKTPHHFCILESICFSILGNGIQWNLDLRKPDLRKNLDLRKIVATTDFLVHKLLDLRKIF